MITSATEGRMRIRHALLRQTERLTQLKHHLMALTGVTAVDANPRLGSLLLRFDPEQIRKDEIEALLTNELPPDPQPSPVRHKTAARAVKRTAGPLCSSRTRRRCQHLGMIATLGGSLAALAFHSKTAHIRLGIAFVALSTWHMAEKRRRLLA